MVYQVVHVEETALIQTTEKALNRLSNESGRFAIPSYIQQFLTEKGKDIDNFDEMHNELIKNIPGNVQVPTLAECYLYYNFNKLQKVADIQLKAMAYNKAKVKELSKNPTKNAADIKWHTSLIQKNERKHHELVKDLMKYSNYAVDRETPTKIETHTNYQIMDLASIHQMMRDIKKNVGDDDSVFPKEKHCKITILPLKNDRLL